MTVTVTEMAVSVKVLTVDGSRRMSHKFYDQIPHRDVIDEHGELVDGAELWGQTRLDRDYVPFGQVGVEIVWTLDGQLYVAQHVTRGRAVKNLEPISEPDRDRRRREWNDTVDEYNAAMGAFNLTVKRLRDELPQLFVGG